MSGKKAKRKYVTDLIENKSSKLDEMQERLIDELARKKFEVRLDREYLGDQVYKRVLDRICQLNKAVVNDAIATWVQGLVDGFEGEFSGGVQFPFLQDEKDADPLTVTYSVPNEDYTRTEIGRFSLEKVLMGIAENDFDRPALVASHAGVVAARLRRLADRFERAALEFS